MDNGLEGKTNLHARGTQRGGECAKEREGGRKKRKTSDFPRNGNVGEKPRGKSRGKKSIETVGGEGKTHGDKSINGVCDAERFKSVGRGGGPRYRGSMLDRGAERNKRTE